MKKEVKQEVKEYTVYISDDCKYKSNDENDIRIYEQAQERRKQINK